MSETSLVKEVLVEVSRLPAVRVWRVNTGVGYGSGELAKLAIGVAARPVRYGIPGQADISGIIGPAGRRLEIECKAPKGRQSEAQKRWQQMIESLGGLYILGRSAEQVVNEIKYAILQKTNPAESTTVFPGSVPRRPVEQATDASVLSDSRRAA